MVPWPCRSKFTSTNLRQNLMSNLATLMSNYVTALMFFGNSPMRYSNILHPCRNIHVDGKERRCTDRSSDITKYKSAINLTFRSTKAQHFAKHWQCFLVGYRQLEPYQGVLRPFRQLVEQLNSLTLQLLLYR